MAFMRITKTSSEAVQLPIFLYNVPGRTGSDMIPELIGRLSTLPNIVGIKDASGDVSRVARHTALCGKDSFRFRVERTRSASTPWAASAAFR